MITVHKSFLVSALTASTMMAMCAHAQNITKVSAQDIGQETQVRIGFDANPVLPTAYAMHNPERLVLDFASTGAQTKRNIPLRTLLAKDATLVGDGTNSRMVIELGQAARYVQRIEGKEVVLSLQRHNQPAPAPTGAANPLLNTVTTQFAPATNVGISSVQYSANGEAGNVSLSLSDDTIPLDVQRQGNRLMVRTNGTRLPAHLVKTIQGSGLVSRIIASNQGNSGVISINMTGDFEYQAYQVGNQVSITITNPELLREPTLEERTYTGEALSMEFQDVQVRTILQVLSEFTGQNIVVSDSVTGDITLRLINVPWDQALDIILRTKNLGKRVNGNVMLVGPAVELAEQEAQELEALQKITTFAPLRTEYIRLNYARAEDVIELFNKFSQGASTATIGVSQTVQDRGILSSRGSVAVDARTNTLIVKDTSDNLENVRAMIAKIDIPVRQVMIEARVVNASDTFSKSLGVSWGILAGPGGEGRPNRPRIANSNGTLMQMRTGQQSESTNLNVNLGATNLGATMANPASIAFGILNMSDLLLDLELSAMQVDNKGEVISRPKVLTADKQTAKISSGTQIAHPVGTASGATAIEYKEAALSLEATPNITPDGRIGLKLNIKNGSPIVGGGGDITEQAISTNIVVEDGQTVVIGGVFVNNKSNAVDKVPFFGDLPIVGRAFRRDSRKDEKNELLIFVTPRLVDDGVSNLQ